MWLSIELPDDDVHVVPHQDINAHKLSMTCKCKPNVDDEYDNIVIHNSFDGREDYEDGYRSYN